MPALFLLSLLINRAKANNSRVDDAWLEEKKDFSKNPGNNLYYS